MKTEKLLGVGLLVFAALKLTEQPRYIVRPAPPAGNLQNNYAAWLQYARLITDQAVKLYGSVQNAVNILWGPGGPFEKTPVPQYDAGSLFWQDVDSGKIAGIGKFYDSTNIRPSGRVDRYWNDLTINAQNWGVEKRNEKFYFEPSAAVEHFGLYSIEFGNWLNQEERFGFMYATLVTLRDIGAVTGVKQSKLGMGKRLALAFGARGNGGRAAAFYIPEPYHLINLTKTNGRGSFCHEYGHAVDFYFKGASGWQSTRKQPDYSGIRTDSVDYLFEKAIEIVLWKDNGEPSSYQNWLLKQTEYYNRRNEIWARMCERYFMWKFKENGIYNTWGVDRTPTADLPDLDLIKKAAPYINKIFSRLNGRSIGAIYPEIPALYECNDGTFTTSDSPRGKVAEFVQKNTFFGQFDPSKPLNIQNLLTKSPAEMEYDLQIDAARAEVQAAENDLRAKIRQLAAANASKTDVSRITAPLEARLRNARLELSRLLQAREKVIEYSKNEPALFGYRRPRLRAPLFCS